jgi:hypothetical protein
MVIQMVVTFTSLITQSARSCFYNKQEAISLFGHQEYSHKTGVEF